MNTNLELKPLADEPTAAEGPARPVRANVSAFILAAIVLAIVGATAWYLSRPASLLIQGTADSMRIDIAARQKDRRAAWPGCRGRHRLSRDRQPGIARATSRGTGRKAVADAELARLYAGTRSERIAERRAGVQRAAASVALAQPTP
jgi:hypothetical protein